MTPQTIPADEAAGVPSDRSVGRDVSAWPESLPWHEPQAVRVATGGTDVELLVWGKRGLPGLFLLHGAGAHAHWWDSVAPLLAETHRVAAMTLPGNGRSAWRSRYASADFFEDALACVRAASLADAGRPVFVGHSMGGAHLMYGAVHAPEMMGGLVLVDTSFRSPVTGKTAAQAQTRRMFATEAEALSRFRLTPPGPARKPALLMHVARHALMQTSESDGGTSWCWRADPAFWTKFEPGIEQGPYTAPLRPKVPAVHMIAEHSHVAAWAASSPLSDEVIRIVLPKCGHHVMLDQPLALVAALRTLLAVWPWRPE